MEHPEFDSEIHEGAGADRSRRFDRMLFRAAVAIAASPIAISAIRNGLLGWYPSADAAITAVRTNDVFSAHPPLVGLPAAPSVGSVSQYDYFGAPINYLMAIPQRLFGVTWGIVIGMGILNTIWFVLAMWLIRRRVGYRVGVVACAFAASLLWGVGSQVLIDPTPVGCGIVASVTLLAAAWSVADGDPLALLPFALVGNFLLLTHPKYLVVVPLLGLVGLALWVVRLRARRNEDRVAWPAERRRHARWMAASLLATVILWIPPLVQQVASTDGNMGRLLRALTTPSVGTPDPAVHQGVLDAVGVVSSSLTTWPLWLRDSYANPNYWRYGPRSPFVVEAVGIAVLLTCLVLVGLNARRRRDRTVVTLVATAAAAWAGWVISAIVQPADSGWMLRYFHAVWPVAMFVWLAVVIGIARSGWLPTLRRRLRIPQVAPWAAGALCLVFAALTVPIAELGAATSQPSISIAQQVRRGVVREVPAGGPVLVSYRNRAWPYVSPAMLGLQENGVEFRFADAWAIRTYGTDRTFEPVDGPHPRELLVSDEPPPMPGWRLIVAARPGNDLSQAQYDAIGRRLRAWAASHPTLEVPEAAVPDAVQRSYIRGWFDHSQRDAADRNLNLFDLADAVNGFANWSNSQLLDLLDAPGITRAQKRVWLREQAARLSRGSVFVYLKEP